MITALWCLVCFAVGSLSVIGSGGGAVNRASNGPRSVIVNSGRRPLASGSRQFEDPEWLEAALQWSKHPVPGRDESTFMKHLSFKLKGLDANHPDVVVSGNTAQLTKDQVNSIEWAWSSNPEQDRLYFERGSGGGHCATPNREFPLGELLFPDMQRADHVHNWTSPREKASAINEGKEPDLYGRYFVHQSHKRGVLQDQLYPCAKTICDFPEVNDAYNEAITEQELDVLTIPTKVIIFEDSQGNRGVVDDITVKDQMDRIQTVFDEIDVTLDYVILHVKDSEAWAKTILPDEIYIEPCLRELKGNGRCDSACDLEWFGWDHGECISPDNFAAGCEKPAVPHCVSPSTDGKYGTPTFCNGEARNNDYCDLVCNHPLFDWDHGDCCAQGLNGYTSPKCFEDIGQGTSDDSRKYSIMSMATFLFHYVTTDKIPQINKARDIIIVPHNWIAADPRKGVAGFPWNTAANVPPPGLTLINTQPLERAFGIWPANGEQKQIEGITTIHELGHIFGLYHTFTSFEGLSSSLSLTQDSVCRTKTCMEVGASMRHGDMCQDTRPTPQSYDCKNPLTCKQFEQRLKDNPGNEATTYFTPIRPWCRDCLGIGFFNTAFRNAMSYGEDVCQFSGGLTRLFTPQQKARMRCHAEHVFIGRAMQTNAKAAPVRIAPYAVSGGDGANPSVTIEWLLPVYLGEASPVEFEMQRQQDGSTSIVQLDSSVGSVSSSSVWTKAGGPKTLVFVDTADLTSGQRYKYRVRVKDAQWPDRWSPWSTPSLAASAVGCPQACHEHGTCTTNTGGGGDLAFSCDCDANWASPSGEYTESCSIETLTCGSGSTCYRRNLGNHVCDSGCSGCELNGRSEADDCAGRLGSTSGCVPSVDNLCIGWMWANGVCDPGCDTPECRRDFGDCEECAPGCAESFRGDGVCDEACNVAACEHDLGDCSTRHCNKLADGSYYMDVACRDGTFVGDGVCQEECNTVLCSFDGGDCARGLCAPGCNDFMVGDGDCQLECAVVDLHRPAHGICFSDGDDARQPDGGDCTECAPGCAFSDIGDGVCNSACRTSSCLNDLLDCQGCTCTQVQITDGRCDSECNVQQCYFDGGACGAPSQLAPSIVPGLKDEYFYIIIGCATFCCCFVCVPLLLCLLYTCLIKMPRQKRERERDRDREMRSRSY